ncbi:MAG: type II toxin-antitoxin system RelE/ParE family toxin [Pseudorhodoplanes sp.]
MARRPVSVIELAAYRRRATVLLADDEQAAVIDLIAYEPECGDLIPGGGGLRKVRVALSGSGKRGGARVIYYFYDAANPILLLALYAKNEKSDLSAAEKKELAGLVKEIADQWKRKRKSQ